MDLRETELDWIHLVQYRIKWWVAVNMLNFWVR